MRAKQMIIGEILITIATLSELQEELEIRSERSWGE